MVLEILSLFAGIGGLDLGLERAGLGVVTLQCEKDPFCLEILAKRWPDVKRCDHVYQIEGIRERWGVVCGGFPCTDVSSAGKRAGLGGRHSGLWYEMLRIVDETRPLYTVIENVAGGARRWLPYVRRDLHVLGYRTRALALSAFDVGAPHLRRRVFVLAADPERVELRNEPRWSGGAGRQASNEPSDDGAEGASSDADGQGELEPSGCVEQEWRWSRVGDRWHPEPPVPGVDDGVSPRMERRLDRERVLGNACIPACAEVAGRFLMAETRVRAS